MSGKKKCADLFEEFACLKAPKTLAKEKKMMERSVEKKKEAEASKKYTLSITNNLKTSIVEEKKKHAENEKKMLEDEKKQAEEKKKQAEQIITDEITKGRTLTLAKRDPSRLPAIISYTLRDNSLLYPKGIREEADGKLRCIPALSGETLVSTDVKLGYSVSARPSSFDYLPVRLVPQQGDHIVLEVFPSREGEGGITALLKLLILENFDSTTKLIIHLNIDYPFRNDISPDSIVLPKLSVPYSVRVMMIEDDHHTICDDFEDMGFYSWKADIFRITPNKQIVILPYEKECVRARNCPHSQFVIPSLMKETPQKFIVQFISKGLAMFRSPDVVHTIEVEK